MASPRPRVLTVVGNRPQFIKAAAVSRQLRRDAEEILVHSGQHYDRELSEVFFEELELPAPDHQLGIGSGTHAEQTAAAMLALEPLTQTLAPDAILVYGDTNTTLAAGLVGAKLGVPIAHVEAGMRSFARSMPEEVNRVAVDHLGDLLLCATPTAVENLRREGLGARARLVGDVMLDLALALGPVAERRSTLGRRLGLSRGEYLVATLHRAGNVDDPARLRAAVELLLAAAERHGPLLLPLHPRTKAALARLRLSGRLEGADSVQITEPLGYLDLSALVRGSRAVLTDSGGLQKEAYFAGVPCLTLRAETEWVETLGGGWNQVVDLDLERALDALADLAEGRPDGVPDLESFGDGRAGERCATELLADLAEATASV